MDANRKAKVSIGRVIGSRTLLEVGSRAKERAVVVRIGAPRKSGRDEWVCKFAISGLGIDKVQQAHGIDALQALTLALEGVRITLDASDKRLRWAGGEDDPGFPRIVPLFYGSDFSRRLNKLIDREIERFARAAERQHRLRRKEAK